MGWDIIKDIAELAGTIGTAAIFWFRTIVKAKLRDQIVDKQIRDMEAEITDLRAEKIDKELQEKENHIVRDDIRDLRDALRDSHGKLTSSIERLTETASKTQGIVETMFIKLKNQA